MTGNQVSANGVPAVDRAVRILEELLVAPEGLDLGAAARLSGASRSSAYRILNSLERGDLVRRVEPGRYALGPRHYAFGEAVATAFHGRLLPDLLRLWMEAMACATDETVRLSVYDRGMVLLIAGTSPAASHALSFQIGQAVPLHAGGGSKVLLAHRSQAELASVLDRPLERFTERTITDPEQLRAELVAVRQRGWAHDPGEYSSRVQSHAVPIRDGNGTVVAAASVAYAATEDETFHRRILDALLGGTVEAELHLRVAGLN